MAAPMLGEPDAAWRALREVQLFLRLLSAAAITTGTAYYGELMRWQVGEAAAMSFRLKWLLLDCLAGQGMVPSSASIICPTNLRSSRLTLFMYNNVDNAAGRWAAGG